MERKETASTSLLETGPAGLAEPAAAAAPLREPELATPGKGSPLPRDPAIDLMRGLLILFVVIGHTNSPFIYLLYSFHMPAWFILSGYLHRDRGPRDLFVSRFAALIVPYVLANLAVLALLFALNFNHLNYWLIKSGSGYKLDSLFDFFRAFSPVSGLLGAAWFLPVLFGATLLASGLLALQRRLGLGDGLLALGSFGLMFVARAMGPLPYYADLMVFCQFFYVAGWLVRRGHPRPDAPKTAILALVAVMFLAFEHIFYNRFFNVAGREYNSICLLILFTFSGTYLVCLAARAIARVPGLNQALAFTGRKSLHVLLLHFFGFRIYVWLLVRAFHYPEGFFYSKGPAPLRSTYPHWYFTALFGLGFALAAGCAIEFAWRAALRRLAGPNASMKSLVDDFCFKKPLA